MDLVLTVRQCVKLAEERLLFFPLQRNSVIGSMGEVLAGAEIAFGGGDGGVAEQQLNLLELAARGAAEFGAGAAEVVGLDFQSRAPGRKTGPRRARLEEKATSR